MGFEGLQWDVGWWTLTQVGYGDLSAPLNSLFLLRGRTVAFTCSASTTSTSLTPR